MSLSPIIQDQTTHLLKMKWDAKYRAEFEALQADLAQAEKVLANAPVKAPATDKQAEQTELDRKVAALFLADEIVAKVKAKQAAAIQKTVFQTNPTTPRGN